MDLVGDERAQSIQIGAVLIFGVLIVAFSSYQAFVVPDQNRGVEFNHNQEVHSQMQDLRNAIVSVGATRESQAVSVQLGTQYPTRAIARNPPPPSGSLRTVGTTDGAVSLTIANARATGETGDFWNEDKTYNTGAVRYRPSYNVYVSPPDTVYDGTGLYNRFPTGTLTLANQTFIDGTEISLVMLNGTLSEASTRSATVDVRAESSSTETVTLDDDGSPILITFASTRSADYWEFLETTQSATVADVRPAGSANGLSLVTVELDDSQAYQVQLTKVGVGTGVSDENAAYLTDVSGDGAKVEQGGTTPLTVEVRDRYNNPPDNWSSTTVEAEIAGSGTFESSGTGTASKTPDADGQVTFEYQAPASGTGTPTVRFSYVGIDGSFDASTPQDVSMTVELQSSGGGGGGGAYALNWADPAPDNPNAALSSCSASDCTWDVGGSADSTLTLRAGTTPALDGFDVEFAGTDSSVGTVSPDEAPTGSSGEVTTELTANANGVVDVYAASGGSSDAIGIRVENFGGGGGSSPSVSYTGDGNTQTGSINTDASFEFGIRNDGSSRISITDVSVTTSGDLTQASQYYVTGNNNEIRISSDSDGNSDAGGIPNSGPGNPSPSDPDTYATGQTVTVGENTGTGPAETDPGSTATIVLGEFRDDTGTTVSLSGIQSSSQANAELTVTLTIDGTDFDFYFNNNG